MQITFGRADYCPADPSISDSILHKGEQAQFWVVIVTIAVGKGKEHETGEIDIFRGGCSSLYNLINCCRLKDTNFA